MATFAEMQADLQLMIMGALSPDTIVQLLNRAQAQILESFDWSFLHVNTVINSVAPKAQGVITVSQGQSLVLGTGTAFGPEDKGAFLWVGGLQTAPIPIAAVQGTAILTLASPWSGPTFVNIGYSLAPLYYLVEDALEIFAVRSIVNLEQISRASLNAADPARVAQGGDPSTHWTDAPVSPDGSLRIELWPTPADTRAYLIEYKRKAPQLTVPNDTPLCPYACIEAKAAMTACQALYGSTGQASWMQLAQKYTQEYADELDAARAVDARRVLARNGVTRSERTPGQWDALFGPVHDMDCPP
jgi:hypothetical protein